jgi:thiol-disulfide isomerase/thioredoxin
MRKLFISFALFFATLSLLAQKKPKTIKIQGTVTGDTKGYNYVLFYTSNAPMDSAEIKDGKFTITLPFSETYMQVLVTQYEMRGKRGYRPFPILLDGTGNVKINMDMEKGFFESSMSGSKTAVAYHQFLKMQNATFKRISDDLTTIYGKPLPPQNNPLTPRISASRDSLMKLYFGAILTDFVKEHKNDYVGVYVLYAAGRSYFDLDKLDQTLQSLSKSMQETPESRKLSAYIRGVRNTTIGATVSNFVLNDPDGKPVGFAQFRGKYVWIDFWASWCGPCKQAFPHMKDLYAKYKDKGLVILGISADSKIDPWLKILPTLNNPWPQVWDNKDIMSEFAVTAFPTSFLIDPNGKILLKEIGYNPDGKSPMDQKLEEIFSK